MAATRIFGVFLIVGAVGLFLAEIPSGGSDIPRYGASPQQLDLAITTFVEHQTIIVMGFLLPWLMLGTGVSLLFRGERVKTSLR